METASRIYCLGGTSAAPLTVGSVCHVAQVAGTMFKEKGKRVIVVKDPRKPNYTFESALIAGLLSVGMDVFSTGPMPISGVSFLVRSMRCNLGVMISAPGEPYTVSGITFFDESGACLSEADQRSIADESGLHVAIDIHNAGQHRRIPGTQSRYIEASKHSVPELCLEGFRIVVDCAHGAGYDVIPRVLSELGAEVFSVGTAPNGRNINQGVGYSYPDAACDEVLKYRADIGLVFDSDGAQIHIVDNKGMIVPPSLVHTALSYTTPTTGDEDLAQSGLGIGLRSLRHIKEQKLRAHEAFALQSKKS